MTEFPRFGTRSMTRPRIRIIRLAASALFASLVVGCSSQTSEGAGTDAETQEASSEPATEDASSAASSDGNPKSAEECIEELFDRLDPETIPSDLVEEGLSCGPDAFRNLLIPQDMLAMVEQSGFGPEAAQRFEECFISHLDHLSDDDLIDFAAEYQVAYDFTFNLAESTTAKCFSAVGSLNQLTSDQILDGIVQQSADPELWAMSESQLTGSQRIAFAEHDRVVVSTVRTSDADEAFSSSILFRTASPYSRVASETLTTFLELFGVEAPPRVVHDALHGGALPTTETVRFCRGLKDDRLYIRVIPAGVDCIDLGQP